MTKRHKVQKNQTREIKPNFLETHWEKIVIPLLIVLPLIYFSPFLNPNKMIAGSDYLIGGYPFEKWIKEQHELPLWYPDVFSGIPVLGAPSGGPLAPLNLLKNIMPPQVAFALAFIIFFFIAGLGTYLYLKEIGLSPFSAAMGAFIYQFAGNLATTPEAGHAGRAASIATFPLILFFIHCGLRSKRLSYFILTGLVTAFAFYEGHLQITYYGLLFIIGYVIYYLVAHRKEIFRNDLAKIFVYGLSTIVLICLLMAATWLPVLGGLGTAARGVVRGYEYATSWSMPPQEIIDLFIPSYSGLLENYWGFNSFKIHLEYFGLFALILAIITIVLYWKKSYVKFYAISILVVILVAIGGHTPFFRIFYILIPGFKLFRAPALIFYLISFSAIILAAIGFDNIFIKKQEEKEQLIFRRNFYIIGIIMLAIFIIIALIYIAGRDGVLRSMQDSFYQKFVSAYGVQIARAKISNMFASYPKFIEGIWRSLIFLIIILSMIYASIKKRIKPWIFATIAIALSLFDQLTLVSKFRPSGPSPDIYYAADDVVKFLRNDRSIFRIFPFQYEHSNDSYLLYHNLQSAGGYIPNPIQRYQDFIGAGTSVMFNPINLIQFPSFVDMLNVKYIIAPNLPEDISRYDAQSQRYINEMNRYLSRFSRAFVGQQNSVYLNDSALGRAYFVADYQVGKEPKILGTMESQDFNPRQIVILSEDPKVLHPDKISDLAQVEIKIIQYSANKIVCTNKSAYPGFLVLADNWHPDWQVFVDGENSNLYRANYTFRAVYLTAGEHEVVFAYISPYFNTGKVISIVAFILSLGFCLLAIIFKV